MDDLCATPSPFSGVAAHSKGSPHHTPEPRRWSPATSSATAGPNFADPQPSPWEHVMSAVALVDLKSRAPARLQSSDVTTQSEGTLHHAAEPRRWPTGWWSTLRRVVGRPQRHITRPLPLCSRGLLHGALAQAAPAPRLPCVCIWEYAP
jgi:hypothetical protein